MGGNREKCCDTIDDWLRSGTCVHDVHGWAVCRLHANTSLMHAMHAMQRPVWDQSGLRSISYVAPKGACRSRTRRSPRHARIAELQPDWRNPSMISSPRCIISLWTTNEGLKHQVISLCSIWATKSTSFEHFEFCHFRHGIRLIQAKIRLQRIHLLPVSTTFLSPL